MEENKQKPEKIIVAYREKKKDYKKPLTIFLILGMLFLGGSVIEDEEVGSNDYDTSFYVEDSDNLFIKLAKVIDRCCYFAIDIIISGIDTIFDIILGR